MNKNFIKILQEKINADLWWDPIPQRKEAQQTLLKDSKNKWQAQGTVESHERRLL